MTNSESAFGPFKSQRSHSRHGLKQNGPSVHPLLRMVSAFLIAALAFTGVPVVGYGQEITEAPESTQEVPVFKVTLDSLLPAALSNTTNTDMTTVVSGTYNSLVSPYFSITSGTANLKIAGLTFAETTPGDLSSSVGQFAGLSGGSLTLYGKFIDFGDGTTMNVGLTLPDYGMTLLMGTVDGTTNSIRKINLAASQSWSISGGSYSSGVLAGAEVLGSYVPARVENALGSATPVTLTLDLTPKVVDGATNGAAAWLDVGDSINIVKNSTGDLYLFLGDPASSATRKAFNGRISIKDGSVTVGPGFLSASSTGVAPTISFTSNNGVLSVVGLNTVSNMLTGGTLFTQSSVRAGSFTDPYTNDPIESGTLAILVSSGSALTLGSRLNDGLGLEPLTIRKQGLGSLQLTNAANDFSGGFILEAGTLILGTFAATGGTVGAVGLGDFVVVGGDGNTTIRVPKAATGFESGFVVTLVGGTGQQVSTAPKVFFAKDKSTDTDVTLDIPSLMVVAATQDLTTPTVLELNNTVHLRALALDVSGTLVKSGLGSLTIGDGLANSTTMGTLVLNEGSLILADAVYRNATFLVGGSAGATRNLVLSTNTAVQDPEPITSRVWSASLGFNGNGNTLSLLETNGFAAGISVQNAVVLTVQDGTLSLGNLQKASGATSASFSKAGLGTLLFAGTSISSGAQALGSVSLLAGTVHFSGGSNASPMGLSGTLVVGTATATPLLSVDTASAVLVSGSVNGTGFTKIGAGSLTFSGTNTISGTSTLRAGTLSLASGRTSQSLRVGDALTTADDVPTLVTTGTVASPVTVGSGAAAAYTAVLASTGTSGMSTFSGSITLSTGSAASASVALQAATGGTLNFSGSWNTGNRPIAVGSASRGGTVRLASALSTTGGVSVTNGSLLLGTTNALGATTPVTLNGGFLNLATFSSTAGAVTLTAGSIYGTGTLSAASLTAQSGSIYASLAGTGVFTKSGPGSVTLLGASNYTGATTVSAGTLTTGLPASSSISISSGATYKLALTANGTYSGTVLNNGTVLLSSTAPVTLTLGTTASLTGSLQIGGNVTLKAGTGASNLFGSGFTLTLDGGKFDANGTTQTISNIVFTSTVGGSLFSSAVTAGTITTTTVPTSNFSNILFPISRKTNQLENGTLASPLEFYAGSLGDLASGGTYSQIITRADLNGANLRFDKAVVAGTSVVAQTSSGSLYTLSVEAQVTVPLFEVQKGVTAVFASSGTLAGNGTLQIGGTVSLSGLSKAFSTIVLNDGSLTNGTLSGGTLTDTGAGASVIAVNLSSAGNITKTGLGTLTISGSNNTYGGSLWASAGTVRLGTGNTLPLGTVAKVGSLAAGATLQLAGNNLVVGTLSGAGVIENAASQAGTLTLNTTDDANFAGFLRDGTGGGSLAVVKDGLAGVTLGGVSSYTGGTTVRQGRLQLSGGALPSERSLSIQGGTLNLGGTTLVASSYSQTAGILENGSLTLNSGSFLLSGGTVGVGLSGSAGAFVSSGEVTLAGTGAYSGVTVVASGKLKLGAGGALPSSTSVVIQAGTGILALGGTTAVIGSFSQAGGSVEDGTVTLNAGSFALSGGTVAAALAGSAGASVTGNVTLRTGALYAGPTFLSTGSLKLEAAGLLPVAGTLNILGGTFSLGGKNQTVGAYAQNGGVVEGGTVTLDSGSFALSGGTVNAVLAGTAGAIVDANLTQVTLNAAASYTGATVLKSGLLQLGSSGSLAATTAFSLQGGTWALGGKTQTVGGYSQSGGSVSGGTVLLNSGSFLLNGGSVSARLAGSAGAVIGGSVTLNNLAAYSGATSLNNGRLLLASGGALPSTTDLIANGGTLNLGGKAQTVGAVTLNSGLIESGTLTGTSYTLAGGSVTAALAGTGSASVTGAVTLSGVNTFSGTTTLAAEGQLTVANPQALASSRVDYSGGTITFAKGVTAATFAGLTGTKDLALANADSSPAPVALTVATASDLTYGGLLSGAGSLIKSGSGNLTLSQTPTYLGITTVTAGSLTLNSGGLLSGNRPISNAGVINLTLSPGSLTYGGSLTGNGTLNLKTESGSVTLTLDTGAKIGGNIVLGSNITLDVSQTGKTGVAVSTSLTLGTGSAFKFEGSQQMFELDSLILSETSRLYANANGGTIYYNQLPRIFNNGTLQSLIDSPLYSSVVSGSLTFEENSRKGTTFAGGIYEFVAGRVKDLPADARQLLLTPTDGRTVRITTGTSVSQEVVASGTGFVNVGTLVTTPLFRVGARIVATVTDGGSLSSNGSYDNSGTLQFSMSSGGEAKVVSNVIKGAGVVEKIGAGSVAFSASNTYTGQTWLSGGTLQINSNTALGSGSLVFKGGTLRYGPGRTVDLSRRIAPIGAGTQAAIDTGGNKVTFAENLTGAGGIAKLGSGTLILSGSNTFSGSIQANQGTLQIGTETAAAANIAAASAVIENEATLRFVRSGSLTYSGSLAGVGTLEQAGPGVVTLNGNMSAFAGSLRLTQGIMALASATANGGSAATVAFNGGTLRFAPGGDSDFYAKIVAFGTSTASVDTSANQVIFRNGLAGTGGLTKRGTGTLELFGANTYTGTTEVLEGLLRAGTALAGSTGTVKVTAGTFEAVSFNKDASLTLAASGSASLSGGTMLLASLNNVGTVRFTADAGSITIGSLSGGGVTKFEGDATVSTGSISGGTVEVRGWLYAKNISSGSVKAETVEVKDTVFGGQISTSDLLVSDGTVKGGSIVATVSAAIGNFLDGSLKVDGTSVTLGTVSGGILTLATRTSQIDVMRSGGSVTFNSGTSVIDVLNGGAITNNARLTVLSGDTSNPISGTGILEKSVDPNLLPSLSDKLILRGSTDAFIGSTNVLGGTLEVAGNATLASSESVSVNSGAQIIFSAPNRTITLKSLRNDGFAEFAGNASITTGSLSGGTIAVRSGRLTANIEGGSVTAAALTAGTVSGGTISINSGESSITQLTDNASIKLILGQAANLSVSNGTFNGTLAGNGTLTKISTGSLSLSMAPPEAMRVNVQGGTLNVGLLLTGTRSVFVDSGATLNTSFDGGTFSGQLTGQGNTILSGAGSTFTLGTTGLIDGTLTLGANATMAFSGTSGIGANTSFNLLQNSTVDLSMFSEVELVNLVFRPGSKLLTGGSLKIYYDKVPVYMDGAGDGLEILDPTTNALIGQYSQNGIGIVPDNVSFEENSKINEDNFRGGVYEFIAGRVKDLPSDARRLLLTPITGRTIRITTGTSASQEVVASGTGFVTVGTLVTTPLFRIGAGIVATVTESGSLSSNGSYANSGTLQFSMPSGSKRVSTQISGTGRVEKIDSGTVVFSASNDYSGETRLSGGLLQFDANSALGTGTIVFNGGGLAYGPGIGVDLSNRIAPIGSGIKARIDTGTNTVTYAKGLRGDGEFEKTGSGTLVLTGTNAFQGLTYVTGGTLQIGAVAVDAGTLAAPVSIGSDARLRFARSGSINYAGDISGDGIFEQAGTGQLSLAGDATDFDGVFALSAGTTLLSSANAMASGLIEFKGGTLKYGASGIGDLSARFDSFQMTARVDTGSYDVGYGSVLTGSAGLTKYGLGTLTLSGANTYSGSTAVMAGSLRYTGAGLAAAGTVETQAGTTVILDSVDANKVAFGGIVVGAARIQKTGTGTITLAKSQPSTGGVTIDAGSLELQSLATLGGTIRLNQSGVLDLFSGGTVSGGLNPNANLVFNGGSLRIGATVVTVANLELGSGSILYAGDALEEATVIYSETSGTGVLQKPDNVTLLQYARNDDGSPAPLAGALKGTVTSLPSVSSLTVESSGKRLTLAVDNLNLDTFEGQDGVDIAIEKPVNLKGDFRLLGGSLALNGTLKSKGGSVVLGGSNTSVVGTIATGGSIAARQLAILGSSSITLNNLSGLEGVGTVQVGTSVAGGSSAATLTIPTGTLTVAPRQVLKGGGRIVGDVELGTDAVLSPGNSPGTLYFAGTLNLTSGTVRIEVGTGTGGTLIQDQISVTGAVNVGTAGAGPTFQIVDTDGALASGGSVQSIFTGATPVWNAGTFSFARQSSTGAVLPSVMYTSTGSLAGLQVTRLKFESFAGSAPNVLGFAKALDTRILTQKATTDGLLELGTGITTTEAVPAQLAAALPVAYAEMAALSTQRTLNLHQGLVGRFSSIRTNLGEVPEGAFVGWTTGYGASHKQDGTRSLGTAGFSASSWGDLLGVEQRIGSLLLGVTGAAGRTSATFTAMPGRATTDSWHGGLYGVLDLGGFILESGALYGGTDTKARRTVSAPGLTNREGQVTLSGSEWVANLGIAKAIPASAELTLTPSVRLIAQGQSQSAAKESDMSGLEVSLSKQKTTTFQHQAGVELRQKMKVAGLPAAASLQLDWIHNYNAKGRALEMALSGNPAAAYGYNGSDAGPDAFHVGTALEAVLTERTTLRLGGEYQSQTGLSTFRGSISLGYQF